MRPSASRSRYGVTAASIRARIPASLAVADLAHEGEHLLIERLSELELAAFAMELRERVEGRRDLAPVALTAGEGQGLLDILAGGRPVALSEGRHAQRYALKPEVPIQDGKTIDFSRT